MKILVVGRSDSVHTARWLNQLRGLDWDIHLFPCIDRGLTHPTIEDVVVHHSIYTGTPSLRSRRTARGVAVPSPRAADWSRRLLSKLVRDYRVRQLAGLIRRLRPDVVHTLQIQPAGYLVAAARDATDGRSPPWIHSTWGSDIYLHGRLSKHQTRIRQVLRACDFLVTECPRDVNLARKFGFSGTVLASDLPAGGGFDLEHCSTLQQPDPTSKRPLVILKGSGGLLGRGLVGLRALERCAELLVDHEIVITAASGPVDMAGHLVAERTGLSVRTVPSGRPYDDVLRDYGRARISLALSISDGVPYSLLEAMVMGAFPLQSSTSCAGEWVEDGKNGLLVPPDDPEVVETALRQALTDDPLVDNAAKWNEQLASERLDRSSLRDRAIALYGSAGG